MENLYDEQKRDMAVKKVKAIKGFYKHLLAYIIVNAVMIIMKVADLEPGERFLEFNTFSTAFFWGIGLALHAFNTFGTDFIFGNNWEERKIRKLMDNEQATKNKWE
ncbi:histidine kinase [Flavobacterium sp. Sd200]|uniref:2TM domain-containing protein n=1 Tax=Flavobacterium sp. Sd200 TaxID=2692211 RepID=UPI00136859DE|nr:2TM domain-containing protein [Flavobacterium sp. Sd200]MXN89881.1 histidine kinase [Flavobacterium sp. Sd200]